MVFVSISLATTPIMQKFTRLYQKVNNEKSTEIANERKKMIDKLFI